MKKKVLNALLQVELRLLDMRERQLQETEQYSGDEKRSVGIISWGIIQG